MNDTLWTSLLKKYVEEYKNSQPNFLQQPTISLTTHPNQQKLAKRYYDEMNPTSFFQTVLLPKMYDTIGNPYKFAQLSQCSPLTVQHTYYLYLIKEKIGITVPKDVSHITEIGGGYGNFCRLINNFEYQGRYSIVDFPEMLDIQKDYLSKNSIINTEFFTDCLEIANIRPPQGKSILFATFSVNEMPMETRIMIEPHYHLYDYLFFAHNKAFDGINNMRYFQDLKNRLSETFEIDHFKDEFKNAWFMICKKRKIK